MRFLCLHGRGTNSEILESQMGPLMSKLSSSHTYEFVDGDINCEAATGLELLYPGPFLCYYDRHETDSIGSALKILDEIIEEDGPFDGVIGFSQGAALAASLLLCHQLRTPQELPPFKLAVFIAAGLPLSPYLGIGKDMTQEAHLAERAGGLELHLAPEKILDACPAHSQISVRLQLGDQEKDSHSRIFGLDPNFTGERISIPTIHIIGSNDPWARYSTSLVKLCDVDSAKTHFHKGSHELPKSAASLRQCAEQIEAAVSLTQFSRW